MLKIILVVIGTLAAGVLVLAALQPDSFRIERKTVIKAAPEKVFAHLEDFHAWGAWSPWEKMDPAMQREFTGPASGKGAAYAWNGNKKVGSGRMEILEAVPGQQLLVKLDFLSPFEAHNTAEFTLTPVADGTEVNWAMYGPQTFIGKVMCLIFSMERMVGPDFEAGLASLKAISEK